MCREEHLACWVGARKKVVAVQVDARVESVLNAIMENLRFYYVDRIDSLELFNRVVTGLVP